MHDADLLDREDPDDRDVRRRLLARRLVSHRARTQTVQSFTGLSRHRLETLRQRWGVGTEDRHRGPSPTSFTEFFRNARNLQTATAAALLCRLVEAIPPRTLRGGSSAIETGERLCYAFEALKALYPKAELEFEQLLLLASGLAEGTCLRIGQCRQCGAALLIDTLSVRDALCLSGCSSE